MRRISAPPPNLKRPSTAVKPEYQASYPLKLITPMFGGGYEARKIDPLNPIRSAAVRGSLRQWWRAIVGARYSSPAALYAAEQELWGSAQKPGRVGIHIEISPEELRFIPSRLLDGDNPNLPPYVTLGLKSDKREDILPAEGLRELAFTVYLSQSPTTQPLTDPEWIDVQQAIAAWIKFGGVGARTRRGCGSIGLAAEPSIPLPELIVGAEKNRHNSPLTLLAQSRCYTKNASSAQGAWVTATETYKKFRQGENVGRNPGTGGKPGRSRWPEPNTIREIITPKKVWAHTVPPNAPMGFPRADFGLPIIFHFKTERDSGEIEPKDVTLQGAKTGRLRFSSPIITKAVQIGLNQYVTLIMILDAPKVSYYGALALKSQERFASGKDLVTALDIEMTSAHRTATSPMNGLEAREAFEYFLLNKEGFAL